MPFARSVTARRPNAPSRSWYSANRRSTMSIALCQSSTSASVMQAKMPRFDASLTKAGSGACMARAPAEADQRDVGSLPGRHDSDVGNVDLAGDHLMPEVHDHRGDERELILTLVGDQHPQMLGLALA